MVNECALAPFRVRGTLPDMSARMPCPTCGAEVIMAPEQRPASFPFCSPRCRTIDLGAWANGSYTVAGRSMTVDVDGLGEDDDLQRLRRQADDYQEPQR